MLKINIAQAVFFLLTVFSSFVSPEFFWLAGFVSWLIPAVILTNFVLLIVNVVKQKKTSFLNVFFLILSFPYLPATFAWNKKIKAERPVFSVMSYNVKAFSLYARENQRNKFAESQKSIRLTIENLSDVNCFQEFYHKNDDSIFNTVEKFAEGRNAYFYNLKKKADKGAFGLSIVTKFPLIRKGEVDIGSRNLNACIFADILLGADTLRVYNLHLQSMSIDEREVINFDLLKNKYYGLFLKIKKGFVKRALQAEKILEHVEKSPVKNIILCGDFNDLPYGYVYRTTRQKMKNAFEEKGRGFGFTFNGKLKFLRIDNIFFKGKLDILAFETQNNIKHSDHFPVKALFSLQKSN
jgi:endonuclease/exonuclease/phosphatase family metal-dependent hydrolase